MHLDRIQLRVLGSLIEKEITTPENYPLSLNALINACNQRSSRDPVLDLDEEEVRQALHSLEDLALVTPIHDARVPKYEHRIRTVLNLRRDETALLCLLMLRGPKPQESSAAAPTASTPSTTSPPSSPPSNVSPPAPPPPKQAETEPAPSPSPPPPTRLPRGPLRPSPRRSRPADLSARPRRHDRNSAALSPDSPMAQRLAHMEAEIAPSPPP